MTRFTTYTTLASTLALALAVGGCSSNGSSKPNATTIPSSASTTSSTTSSTTTSPSTTTTTVPTQATADAVWPTPAGGRRFNSPVAAVRSFAIDYLHMVSPLVGAFAQGDARSGEVTIRATARGPKTTVFVRQLDADGSWWITGSATSNIQVAMPTPLARIVSPVTLRGRSTAFEATVNVSIREDDRSKPLAEKFVMGGAAAELGPFVASMSFTQPTSERGAIVFYTISPESGHVSEATVLRVRF